MKLKNNKADWILEILCLIMLIGMILYLGSLWSEIPDKIPAHYNMAGEIDRWGKKGELLVTPIMAWVLYLMISVLEQFPGIWNTGVKVTEENGIRVYRTLKYMIKSLKLIVVADFTYLTFQALTGRALSGWFTAGVLIIVFGDLVFWLIRLAKVK